MGQGEDYEEIIRRMKKQREEYEEMVQRMRKQREMASSEKNKSVDVHNAGLMLIATFFPMLFYRLNLLTDDRRSFRDNDSRMRAIFILQYLVYGEERDWKESELYLNKKIVDWAYEDNSLPSQVKLNDIEKQTCDSVLMSLCKSWDKMRNTHFRAFSQSFLDRSGVVSFDPNGCIKIKVDAKPYDVLLDSLPWTYKIVKFSWGLCVFDVNWR